MCPTVGSSQSARGNRPIIIMKLTALLLCCLYTIVVNAVDCSVENIFSSHETLLNYPYLLHCTSLNQHLVLGTIGLGLYLLILLYFLSSTADGFFCPCLQATVERFHVSPNIAGITFLSFGNGSPDVFSNLAAFSTGTPKIGVAGILGGGLFVTTGAYWNT